MKRRAFIKGSLFGSAALLTFPFNRSFSGKTFSGKVIIIGAGISGLHATFLLARQGIDVQLLEASGTMGGRIRSLNNFSEVPLELGAEKIYGKKTLLYELAKNENAPFSSLKGDTYYALDGYVNTENQLENDEDFKAALAIRDQLQDYSGPDLTVEQFALNKGLSNRMKPLFNAMTANEYGTSMTQLSVNGLQEVKGRNESYILNGKSLSSLLEEKYKSVKEKILFNSVVTSIDYSGETIKVRDKKGTEYTADRVIISVPISVLKAGDLSFTPPLPAEKMQAFSKIGMGPGMKFILKFNKKFWKEDAVKIYAPGYIPEFSVAGFGRSNLLTAVAYGEGAGFLSGLKEASATEVIKQLDTLFGGKVASRSLVDSHVMDWGKEPFIGGAFSFPTPGSKGARDVAAAPVPGKIFFAGEAMHTGGHFATVQGAVETAQKTVEEMI